MGTGSNPLSSHLVSTDKNTEIELIDCPRQPGKLRISKRACALQHIRARKKARKTHGKWEMKQPAGFMICGACTRGRRYAEELEKNLSKL